MFSQGQFKQARVVDLFYNQSKTDGFFFEAGAYDGVAVSNSLFFELQRGWTGLLVEAHPDNYESLLEKNRKAWSLGTCISMSSVPEIVVFDAATIFGGIIQEGRPKPGDSIPSNKREEMQELTAKTRRTIKVKLHFPFWRENSKDNVMWETLLKAKIEMCHVHVPIRLNEAVYDFSLNEAVH